VDQARSRDRRDLNRPGRQNPTGLNRDKTVDANPTDRTADGNTPLRYSVVVPVYNEAENIGRFCETLLRELPPGYEVLVCYDFEGDTTIPALKALPEDKKPPNTRIVLNTLGRGVRYAIEVGLRAAKAPVVIVTMADLSDDYRCVEAMVKSVEEGAALCCGSRYMKGGRQIGGPWLKGLLSRTAGLTLHYFAGIPTHDATNSYKAYSSELLKKITIESDGGFSLGMEICIKAHFMGGRVTQVPCTWYDRTEGQSRFKLWAWIPKYLRWYFYAYKKRYLGWLGF
jgi:glycosyltransferase involved in cell wall biosynthesis